MQGFRVRLISYELQVMVPDLLKGWELWERWEPWEQWELWVLWELWVAGSQGSLDPKSDLELIGRY